MLTLLRFSSILIVIVLMGLSCRTSAGDNQNSPAPAPLVFTPVSTDPILRKSIGGLTQKYPDNRVEECLIVRGDLSNPDEIDSAIHNLSRQELVEDFILRAQIPSIQYFAYWMGEPLLLSEISDEKMRFRRPEGEIGTKSLDILMKIFEGKCGENNLRP